MSFSTDPTTGAINDPSYPFYPEIKNLPVTDTFSFTTNSLSALYSSNPTVFTQQCYFHPIRGFGGREMILGCKNVGSWKPFYGFIIAEAIGKEPIVTSKWEPYITNQINFRTHGEDTNKITIYLVSTKLY